MRLSIHAQQRWNERCGHLSLPVEIGSWRPASKATLNRLRRSWERSQGVATWPADHLYMTSPGGALFVIANDVVITVMLMRDIKRWHRRQDKDDRARRRGAL